MTSFQPGDLWIKGKTSLPCVPGLPLTHPADCGNRDRHACAEWEGHRSRWPWQLRDEAPVLLREIPSPPWLCPSAPGPAPISPFAMKGTQVRSSIVSWPVESQGSKGLSCHIACPFQPKLAVFLPMYFFQKCFECPVNLIRVHETRATCTGVSQAFCPRLLLRHELLGFSGALLFGGVLVPVALASRVGPAQLLTPPPSRWRGSARGPFAAAPFPIREGGEAETARCCSLPLDIRHHSFSCHP